jgi:hypothetical protein
MTQTKLTEQGKQLLLMDLCARLPYGVMCDMGLKHPLQLQRILVDKLDGNLLDFYEDGNDYQVYLSEVKPYLRSMSSMTKEESIELQTILNDWWNKELFTLTEEPMIEYALSSINYTLNPTLFDWLNKKHFDYRGLIKKGLAIKVTEENNPYKL